MEKTLHRKSPPYFGLPKPLASKETRLSDEEVFSALNCDKVPQGVRNGVEKNDFGAAAREWAHYITRRNDASLPNPRLTRPLRGKDLLREADSIRRHKIIAWGFRRTSFGNEINFVTFAAEHRLVEFHHLAFLTYLADAYGLNQSTEPVKAFEDIVCQYYSQQDRVRATTTGHPLWNNGGCGIRVIALIHAYLVMKGSGAFSSAFHTTMLKMVLGYSRWLYRVQEECRPGCEAFDACTALVLAGCCFPEFNEAEEWLDG